MSSTGSFSVFRRLFLIYSLIVFVIYVVLIVIFLNNISQSSRKLIDSKQIQARTFLKNLEQQLDSIYKHEVNLTNNSSVTRLAYELYQDNYEKSQLVLEVIRTIEGIQSMNPMIEEIVVTYPTQALTLSSVSGYEKGIGDEWANVKWGSEYNYLLTYDGSIVMNFSYPLKSSLSPDYVPDYNIQTILSEAYLKDSLNAFMDGRGSGAAIRFDLDEEYYVESNSGTIVADGDGERRSSYQFIALESMKFPLSVVAFTDRQVMTQIAVNYIAVLTVVMLVITSLFASSLLYTKRIAVRPLRELMGAFGRIQEGDFEVRIYHEPHDEFNYLYRGFNKTVSHIQTLISEIYEQENLIQNAELAQLQSQINPHFLYNSFFIISRMAKSESYQQITQFVTSLARYYRFINKETSDYIPLSHEVEHMSNYLDIQQMRFSDKISVKQDPMPNDIKSVSVPKLILQPLIENAYNYGLANNVEDGLIEIGYRLENGILEISVADNGTEADGALVESMKRQLENNRDGGNHALFNIHRRLRLAYGPKSGVSVELSRLGGIGITLSIDTHVTPD